MINLMICIIFRCFFRGCPQKEKKGIKQENRRRRAENSREKTTGQAGPSKVAQEVLADLKSAVPQEIEG